MSEHREFMQPDAIQELRRSKRVVGELAPVIWDDRRQEAVSGDHRLKAGWKDVRHIRTKDDAEFYLLKLHHNVQRKMPPGEVVAMLAAYGEALVKGGMQPGGALMRKIVDASPWDERYTYEMVPRRFKNEAGPGRPPGSPNLSRPQIELPDGFERPPAVQDQELVECTFCGRRGVVVSGRLVEQEK